VKTIVLDLESIPADTPTLETESGSNAPPAQNLTPAQEKLCEEWSSRFGLNQTQHYHGFARELLALREPAPQASIGQPYTEQLEAKSRAAHQ
jgi:hypothetical protein